MNCQACVEFILRYLDGELPDDERVAFEVHLAKCPPCGRYLEQYRVTVKVCKNAFVGKADGRDEVPEALIQAILASRRDI
jgi:anti-sigma factor RsiW